MTQEEIKEAIKSKCSSNETAMYGWELGYKDAIKDACELLSRMVWEVTYEDLEGNSVNHCDKIEFIEEFKKAMEEQQ